MEGGDDSRFKEAEKMINLSESVTLLENIDISHFESQHRIFVVQKISES
jgi:hypothetical protein